MLDNWVSSAMLKYFERTDETGRSWLSEHFHDYCRLPEGEDTYQGTAFRGYGKTLGLKLKKMWKSTRIVCHSAASRNAGDFRRFGRIFVCEDLYQGTTS